MGALILHNHLQSDITALPNQFIDEYMVDAGGEFVKIYLYLLRHTGNPNANLSISSIADFFDHTESDVRRGLRYWEKMQLLKLTYDSSKNIIGITLLDYSRKDSMEDEVSVATETSKILHLDETTHQQKLENTGPSISNPLPDTLREKELHMTPDKMRELSSKEEIKQLLFVVEQYLGKTLSATEAKTILYFYDHLGFSTDLIEYLIEYCVSKGSKSIHYIQTVALSWAKEGIKTVNEAKESTNLYNKKYFTIMRAFGIKGRNPVKVEIMLMDIWLEEFAFTMDIIIEACNRTMAQTSQPSFKYADKILSDWHKNGVKHLSDLAPLDEKHKARAAASANQKPKIAANNKFNNFESRHHHYDSLEQQLLKR
ncbi:MAG TPA: DnaD domain protein [Candidatus Merdenecus merdavium]|nr:DnaD domain protein [Candidatus Merdenecus merdavium]